MLQDIEAIIFDMDGTLIDSMWVWTEIDLEFLGARNLELPDTYQKEIEGMSFTETAVYTKELFGLTESVEELKEIWNDMAMEKYCTVVQKKPGVSSFLSYCRAHGIKLGIATSNSMKLAKAVTERLGIAEYIRMIVTSCEVEKGKPAPDVYLEAARRLDVAPEHCLVFEDIPMGILAGKNAGMKVCAVDDDFSRPQEAKKRELADYYIFSFDEIKKETYEVL